MGICHSEEKLMHRADHLMDNEDAVPIEERPSWSNGVQDVPRIVCGRTMLRHSIRNEEQRRRHEIMKETIEQLQEEQSRSYFQSLANENLKRWKLDVKEAGSAVVRVVSGDWGEVALQLTKAYGEIFAVLNMANALCPGGAYLEGMPAQEENMFRRTDCHFSLTGAMMDATTELYHPEAVELINATRGVVYLDVHRPRVCVRAPENKQDAGLGYEWLPEEEVFPFYELRSAADDLRGRGGEFNEASMRHKVAAQLDSCAKAGVRHVVLSAFGCGAFRNPAGEVARIYKEELHTRKGSFDCAAFAIFHPGYGADNLVPFQTELNG